MVNSTPAFVGRQDITRRIIGAIGQCQSVSITGVAGLGRSRLLNHVITTLDTKDTNSFCIYRNFSEYNAIEFDPNLFWRNILKDVKDVMTKINNNQEIVNYINNILASNQKIETRKINGMLDKNNQITKTIGIIL
jgi:hypothetical protein